MTLEECLEKHKFVSEVSEFDMKYKGEPHHFKIDDKYNRLTIVKMGHIMYGVKTPKKQKACICRCECGNYVGPIRLVSLLNGDSMSCGCYQRELHSKQMKERNFKHGSAQRGKQEHLYILWGAMKDRATNHNRWDAKHYADKGITLYEDWNDYEIFKEWALNNGYSEGMSIDRIDNSKGYCPENCHWIPLKNQNKNKTTNRVITVNGRSQILADWCRELNLNSKLVSSRLSRGWSELRALELI